MHKFSILTIVSGWGGQEVHTTNLAKELVASNHTVEIIGIGHDHYQRANYECKEQILVRQMPVSKNPLHPGALDSLKILLSCRGKIVLAPKGSIDVGSWVFDLLARCLCKRYVTIEHLGCRPMPKKKTARHFWGIVPGIGIWWYRLYFSRRLRALGPHLIICVSDAVRTQLIEHYSFPARKLVTVHNGIETKKFLPSFEQRSWLRQQWKIPGDAFVFGSVGRLVPDKGFDKAIRLFAMLIKEIPYIDIRYVLVGEGSMYNQLVALIHEFKLEEKVLLCPFSSTPWKLYSAFDVFLLPSEREGLPLTILEAMAAKCCPIAMGVDGIPEIIGNKCVGWLIPQGNKDQFLGAMREAVSLPMKEREYMARRARKHVASNFNAHVQFAKLVRLIEDVADRC
jgi:glycosyltransferase involved in cell wall biosynthesis